MLRQGGFDCGGRGYPEEGGYHHRSDTKNEVKDERMVMRIMCYKLMFTKVLNAGRALHCLKASEGLDTPNVMRN